MFLFSGNGVFESGRGGLAEFWLLKKPMKDFSDWSWVFLAVAAVSLCAPKRVLAFLCCSRGMSF